MLTLRHLRLAGCAGALTLGLAGCETVGDTARQERLAATPGALATLAPETRARVARGGVNDGDSFEGVFLALGTPDHVETTADGGETLWIYKKFYHAITINGAPVLGPNPQLPARAALPPKLAPLTGSGMTRDDYARANTHNGMELAQPRQPQRSPEPPPLPFVELEILFRGRQVASITVLPNGLER